MPTLLWQNFMLKTLKIFCSGDLPWCIFKTPTKILRGRSQGVGIRGGIIVLPRRPNYPILSWRIIGAESVGSNPDRVVSFWTTTTPCTQFDSWKRATQWSSRGIKCTQHGVKKLWCFQNILISEFLKILLFPFWRIIIIIFFRIIEH